MTITVLILPPPHLICTAISYTPAQFFPPVNFLDFLTNPKKVQLTIQFNWNTRMEERRKKEGRKSLILMLSVSALNM